MIGRRAQEVGTLTSMLIALVLLSAVAYLGLGYLKGIATNYNVELNESEYTVFSTLDQTLNLTSNVTNEVIGQQGQAQDVDIITTLLTGAYSAVKLFFNLPSLYYGLISSGIQALGIPPESAGVLGAALTGITVILVLGAIIALVLKVRP